MLKNYFSIGNIFKYIIVLICIIGVIFFGKYLVVKVQATIWLVTKNTVETVSRKFWQEMLKDDFGNINVLLVGHGGWNHRWGYLADTLMVASRNPETEAITLVSVPRDLYINIPEHRIKWKINSVFAAAFFRTKDFGDLEDEEQIEKIKFDHASQIMSEKMEDITWLKVPYYAVIDFEHFQTFIDEIWGIDIEVTQRIHDTAYPTENDRYTTFKLDKWRQHLDGATALMYARSRHSTSDFSRSARQQQIIEASIQQVLKKENVTSISRLNGLYEQYTQMVRTNISAKEIIGMFQYVHQLPEIFSYVFTTECSYKAVHLTDAWCFLYVPNRENFWWSSVILPKWATANNVSFYDYTQNFVYYVAHNQAYLKENPNIIIQNGIDKTTAKSLGKSPSGWATKIWVKLKKYAFNISDVQNSEESYTHTTIFLTSTGMIYPETHKMLKTFFNVTEVKLWADLETGADILLIIWDDFLEKMWDKRFSYEK